MQVGQQTTFSQIYAQFKPGPLSNSDQHLRLTGTSLHTHNPLMPHGKGAAALQARLDKYDHAATAVKDAIEDARSRLGAAGRLVIRPSGTEPLIRVMAEGDDPKMVETVVNDLVGIIGEAKSAA